MQWELATNIILISSFVILAVFGVLALYQWISRKSFLKIDRNLRWAPLPLALMAVTYFLFDKIVVLNTRPNGSGESSFPSTHVMIVATIFLLVSINLPKYVKSKTTRVILDILMLALVVLTGVGRIMANMHWPIDVVGGVVFAVIFDEIYYLIIRTRKEKHE